MADGATHLPTLLRGLRPHLHDTEYVFCLLPPGASIDALAPLGMFREQEGTTAILPRAVATAQGLAFTYPCRHITLTIHSSLDAVGMIAAIATRLAEAGISLNPIAAYHHDHLFVPVADAMRAMAALESFATF